MNGEQALVYAQAFGWRIIPLHNPTASGGCSCHKPDCRSPGKHPRTINGLKDGTVDSEQIQRWWVTWPNANIGIVTGAESGLVVLDIDQKNGGYQSLEALVKLHGDLPSTPTTHTGGGGMHYLFAHPGKGTVIRNSAGDLGPGLDIRGDGGYIVAPPSVHASGQSYQWAGDEHLLAPMPAFLQQSAAGFRNGGNGHKHGHRNGNGNGQGNNPLAFDKETKIFAGERNQTLARRAGQLRRHAFNEDSIYAALCVENRAYCSPPLDEGEVRDIARSVSRYPPAEAGDHPSYTPPEEPLHIVEYRPEAEDEPLPEFALPAGKFLRMVFQEAEEILSHLYRGELMILNALPNAGKSTLMINCGIRLAHGGSFPPLIPAKSTPRKVLYLDFENRAARFQRDFARMCASLSADELQLVYQNFHISVDALVGQTPLSISNREHLQQIARFCLMERIDIVIVDTLAAATSLFDENSNAEMGRKVLQPLRALMRATNTAVALIHHKGKVGSEFGSPVYAGRGASAGAAEARLIFNLENDQHDRERTTLRCPKVKGEQVPDAVLRLNRETRWFSATEETSEPPLPNSDEMVAQLLVERGRKMRTQEIVAALSGKLSKRTIMDAIARLLARGTITRSGRGVYAITDETEEMGKTGLDEAEAADLMSCDDELQF
jgi:RecA-family ATPase